jgi:cephalosporin hydroxylase
MRRFEGDALQVPAEIGRFAQILRDENVRSFLEVGSKFGGSLWTAANALPIGSKIVAVDMPKGTRAWDESRASLVECVAELNLRGYEATVVWGDSTAPSTIEAVTKFGPFDAAFIDANHTLPFVTKDFATYGPMARIVAFHDIAWRRAPDWVGTRIDVPEFWNSIKGDYRHEEIKLCPTGKNNGIGVLWRC